MSEAVKRALALLVVHEGYRAKCYKDASKKISYDGTPGLWTWGYGWCIETRPLTQADIDSVKSIVVIPQEALGNLDVLRAVLDGIPHLTARTLAQYLLSKEVEDLEDVLETRIGFWVFLSPTRKAALIDLAYNMGVFGLQGFPSMLRALGAENFHEASLQLLFVDPHVENPRLSEYASPPPVGVGAERSERIARILFDGRWPQEIPYEE